MDNKLVKFGIGLGVGILISLVYSGVEFYGIRKKQLKISDGLEKLNIDIDHLRFMMNLQKESNGKILKSEEDLKEFLEGDKDFS